jgi:hypothetical protein
MWNWNKKKKLSPVADRNCGQFEHSHCVRPKCRGGARIWGMLRGNVKMPFPNSQSSSDMFSKFTVKFRHVFQIHIQVQTCFPNSLSISEIFSKFTVNFRDIFHIHSQFQRYFPNSQSISEMFSKFTINFRDVFQIHNKFETSVFQIHSQFQNKMQRTCGQNHLKAAITEQNCPHWSLYNPYERI